MTDFELMGAALDEARKAAALGEVPVGAVVAKDGEIVAAVGDVSLLRVEQERCGEGEQQCGVVCAHGVGRLFEL